MGLTFTYQDRRPVKPPAQRNWLVSWIDPDSGKKDTADYYTRADAEKHAATVRDVYGIDATVTDTNDGG